MVCSVYDIGNKKGDKRNKSWIHQNGNGIWLKKDATMIS